MVIMLETSNIKNFDPLSIIKLWNEAPKTCRWQIIIHNDSDINVEYASSALTPQETVPAETSESVATDSSHSTPISAESAKSVATD